MHSFNEARLKPPTNAGQTVESFQLEVQPAVATTLYHDFYSNVVHHFEIPEPHAGLHVESRARVMTHPAAELPESAEPSPLSRLGEAQQEPRCHDFLEASRYVDVSPETWRLAVDATAGITDTWQAVLALRRFVHQQVAYTPNSTTAHTHMREVLRERRGVCQDYAHVMLGLCRTLKIPALYVSGYFALETATATHAWAEVFIPGVGWRALDPTHDCQVDANYIKIAIGRDYADVPPVSGTYKGTEERTLSVDVKIQAAT
jgi:transglutaminase-like putative cysteine protease